MITCIYCLEELEEDAFDREHVMPEAFGRFRDSPVLHQTVCKGCNGYFGRSLDHTLARRSSEGLERYGWGIKPADDVDKFLYGDVTLHLDAPGTEWDQALVRKIPGSTLGETQIELVPQAGFGKKNSEELIHVPIWQIRNGEWKTNASIDLSKGIQVLAPALLYDEVKSALIAQGVQYKEERQLEDPPGEAGELAAVKHVFRLTDELRRGIAKLAFNYLAFRHGRQVALLPAFDAVRRFVRYGETSEVETVRVIEETRLGIHREDGQVPVVHYITLDFDRGHTVVLGHVSLLHWAVYQVVLATTIPHGLERVQAGHLFNVLDGGAYPLELRKRTTSAGDSGKAQQ